MRPIIASDAYKIDEFLIVFCSCGSNSQVELAPQREHVTKGNCFLKIDRKQYTRLYYCLFMNESKLHITRLGKP